MTASILRPIIALLLVAGVIVTQAYVIGFEYHRFFTPSWFFLALVPLLIIAKPHKIAKGNTLIYVSLGLLTLYLGLRGLYSDLPLMAGKDFPVFYYGLITFVAISVIARSNKAFFIIIAVAVGVHCYQILLCLLPERIAQDWPRAWGELPNQRGIFGFFRHHNPFASYCGINAAALAGLAFFKLRKKSLEIIIKLIFTFIAIVTIVATFISGSRLGTAAATLSCVVCLVLGFGIKYAFQNGRLQSRNRLITMALLLVIGLFIGIGSFGKTFNTVSEQRHRSGSLDDDIMSGMRVSAMSMGYSFWMESPLIGNGPRSYWVNAPRLRLQERSRINNFNDPEMVHNDYIQTLAEYGIIGLILVLGTLGVILSTIWQTAYRQRLVNENWAIPPIIATSATLGIMVHALADFTMHNAAVFIQLALVLGATYGYLAANDPGLGTRPKKSAWLPYIIQSVTILLASIILCVIGKNQIFHNIDLVKYDHAKWNKSEEEYLYYADQVAKVAPEPIILEELGITLLNRSARAQDKSNKAFLMQEAEKTLELGYNINPYRITILTNLALAKLKQNKLQEANTIISEAFVQSNHRWKAYHLNRLAAEYLIQQGEQLWFRERKAPEAMAYFIEAKNYASTIKTYKAPPLHKVKKHYLDKTKEYLSTLEAGQVSPETDLVFFNNEGL